MWIFGYGSILWKVDFPHETKRIGCIRGFVRRFYQLSTDHRGTLEQPGRVVTLLPSDNKDDEVWGMAYQISPDKVEDVIAHLDHRERGGYVRKTALFYPKDDPEHPFEIMIYVALEDNRQYAGEASTDLIARQVVEAAGPSGANTEYVLKLAASMREIAPDVDDEHLFEIEEAVKTLANKPE